MAKQALQFRNFPKNAFTTELKDQLALMKEVKQAINDEIINILTAIDPAVSGKRAVHSYKLDFDTGEVELKVALVDKPKAKAAPKPQQTLTDWLAGQTANGSRA